ncbi:MAG: efflux RND transporter periplasmic adaptor subunit [Planctomycetota bacterium]
MASFIRQTLLLTALTAAAAGAAVWWGEQGDEAGAAPARRGFGPTAVETVEVAVERVERTVTAVGTGRPKRSVELKVSDDGRVEEVLFSDGDTVRQGRPLLRLDDASERAALAEAEAAVTEARAGYDRAEALRQQGRVTGSVYDIARAELSRAEARRDAALVNLDRRVLRAPFDGVVGFSDIEPGAFATSGVAVATLDDLSVLMAEFTLPERFFAEVGPGRAVRATTRALPGEVLEGEVDVIDRRVDEATRAFLVRARFPNPDGRLPGGLFMRIELVLQARDGVMAPEEALVPQGGGLVLYVVDDEDRARLRQVEVGARRAGRAEILEGLEAGERVIVRGVQKVRDGAPVRVQGDAQGARPGAQAGAPSPEPA